MSTRKRYQFMENDTFFRMQHASYAAKTVCFRTCLNGSGMAGGHAFFDQSDYLLFVPVGGKGKVAADNRAESGVDDVLARLADIVFPDLKIGA